MKKLITLIAIQILFNLGHTRGQTPVYFNIISHNEISDPLNYRDNVADFNTIQPLVKELCDTIISKQARYNMQVDGNFINGVLTWDNGANNPNDILEWANNSPYIDVDGHNHFNPLPDYADIPHHSSLHNPYKYSDLAKLLDSCGVTLVHNILGGVTYADVTVGNIELNENWTQYATPIPGYTFSNFLWQADIVWGTASPNHIADYTHFGVWKPAGGSSPAQFGTHDPNATITHIGGGCKGDVSYILDGQGNLRRTTDEVISNIKSIVDGIQNNPTSPNDFYTMNMLVNFRDIPLIPNFADSIGVIIEGLNDYVSQGKIVWATLGEKYDRWYAQHTNPNDHFNFDCADVVLAVDENNLYSSKLSIYPNPTQNFINVKGNVQLNQELQIFNLLGEKVYQAFISSQQIDVTKLGAGLYILKIGDNQPIKFLKTM